MPLPNPRVSFKVGAIRVWGECDSVELTAGFTPNTAVLRVPIHEYDKFAGDFERQGSLELWCSSDAAPDVELVGWSIEHVRDSLSGKLAGEETWQVIEKEITLTDRRWEFLDGRGGTLFGGRLNIPKTDGSGLYNLPGGYCNDYPAGATSWALTRIALARMQLASGLPALDLDAGIPTALYDGGSGPMPPDLSWDGVSVPSALAAVLEQSDAVWLLGTDGVYRIALIGADPDEPVRDGPGALPTISIDDALPSESVDVRTTRAGTVIVTSAPAKAIHNRQVGGILATGTALAWEYVVRNTDGTLSAPDSADWLPAGKTAQDVVREGGPFFEQLSESARPLAAGTLFSVIRLRGDDRLKCLPILRRDAFAVADMAGAGNDGGLRPLGVTVLAKPAVKAADGTWSNASDWQEIMGCRVDHVAGIITLPTILGKVATSGTDRRWAEFSPLGNGELTVSFSHEARQGTHADYYVSGWSLVGGVATQLDAAAVTAALAGSASDVKILSMPELIEYGSWTGAVYTANNRVALDAIAAKLAGRLLCNPTGIKVFRYKGLHDVSPNGNITSVRWDLKNLVTEFDCRAYYVGKSRWLDRDAFKKLSQAAAKGQASARAAGQLAPAGAGPYASYPSDSGPGRYVEDMSEPVFRFGKAPVIDTSGDPAWVDDTTDTGNGCYVEVNPCLRDGTHVDEDVVVKVWLPRNGKRKDPNVRQGDVICYAQIASGLCLVPDGLLDGKVDESIEPRLCPLDANSDPIVPAGWAAFGSGLHPEGYDKDDAAGLGRDVMSSFAAQKQGGFDFHGMTENGHPDHVDHSHLIGANLYGPADPGVPDTAGGWTRLVTNRYGYPGYPDATKLTKNAAMEDMALRHGGTAADGVNDWPAGASPTAEAHDKADTVNVGPFFVCVFCLRVD